MRKILGLMAVLALISANSHVFGQWQYNGNDIYYSNGNVGIGTDSPTESLSINGHLRLLTQSDQSPTISSNNGLVLDSGNDWAGIHFTVGKYVGYNKGFHVRNYDLQTLFYIETNGNVGIGTGTSNPSEKLEVNGKIKSSGSNSALVLVSPNGTEWEVTIDNSGNLSANLSTRTDELVKNENITLYPNPSKNIVNIEVDDISIQRIIIELYDLRGRMLFNKSYNHSKVELNLNDFDRGSYIFKVKDKYGNVLLSEKVIKL